MKTVEETRRELFEGWYRGEFPVSELRIQNLIGAYTKHHADLCWQAFNAALDAVVIELPSCFETFGEYSQEAARIATECCAEAIESTNLGLKIR